MVLTEFTHCKRVNRLLSCSFQSIFKQYYWWRCCRKDSYSSQQHKMWVFWLSWIIVMDVCLDCTWGEQSRSFGLDLLVFCILIDPLVCKICFFFWGVVVLYPQGHHNVVYDGDMKADRNAAGMQLWLDHESAFVFLGDCPVANLRSEAQFSLDFLSTCLGDWLLINEWMQLVVFPFQPIRVWWSPFVKA